LIAGGVGVWIATRSPAATPAPVAVAAVDAAVVALAPPPDAAAPPPDAARPIDAAIDAVPRRAPKRAPVPEPDPPDDFRDPSLVRKGLDPIMRKAARCGAWVDHEYSGTLQVDNQGVTSEVVITGPDPAIVACMTRIAQQQRFPRTKFGGGGVSFELMRP
jgi:hypothetical protein